MSDKSNRIAIGCTRLLTTFAAGELRLSLGDEQVAVMESIIKSGGLPAGTKPLRR